MENRNILRLLVAQIRVRNGLTLFEKVMHTLALRKMRGQID